MHCTDANTATVEMPSRNSDVIPCHRLPDPKPKPNPTCGATQHPAPSFTMGRRVSKLDEVLTGQGWKSRTSQTIRTGESKAFANPNAHTRRTGAERCQQWPQQSPNSLCGAEWEEITNFRWNGSESGGWRHRSGIHTWHEINAHA